MDVYNILSLCPRWVPRQNSVPCLWRLEFTAPEITTRYSGPQYCRLGWNLVCPYSLFKAVLMAMVPRPGDPINDEIDAIWMFLSMFSHSKICTIGGHGRGNKEGGHRMEQGPKLWMFSDGAPHAAWACDLLYGVSTSIFQIQAYFTKRCHPVPWWSGCVPLLGEVLLMIQNRHPHMYII